MSTKFEDAFSEEVWFSTYKDHKDNDINDTLQRVATAIASVEKNDELRDEWSKKFNSLLTDFKFVPGGRILANAGTDWKGTTLINCLSGDTKVHLKEGTFLAKDIPVGPVEILTSEGDYKKALWKTYGKQELYEITFSNGEKVRATKGHEWIITSKAGFDDKVTTDKLLNEHVPLNGISNYDYLSEEEYLDGVKNGLVFGDGSLYTNFSKNEEIFSQLQQFGDSRHLILDYFGYTKTTWYKGDPEGIHYVNGLPSYLKKLPPISKSMDYLRGFIAGVIAADGHIDARGSVMLHTSQYEYAVAIRDIAVRCGLPVISLRIEREGKDYTKFATEDSKLWKLTFVKKYFQNDSKLILKNSHKINMSNSPISKNRSTVKCISIEATGLKEEVYCCNEPITHSFTIGDCGLLTGNCFVGARPNNDIDSLDGIITNLRNQVQTLKAEGGWGENFSYIRPRGAFIHGIGVETPGAVKYMELFDKSSDIITAGSGKKSLNKKAKGKIRKGAQMAVLDCWHPDIIEFTTAKQQPGRLTKFNVSVNCTDEFMKKITGEDANDEWQLRFPDTQFKKFKSEWDGDIRGWEAKGYPVTVHNTVSAKWLWNLIMESTYNRAEPGVLFLDRANQNNPLYYKEKIMATNPCGEQTLSPANVCCLGSLNLTQFIDESNNDFDYRKLKKFIPMAVRFLDNVDTYSDAPLKEYKESMMNKRRIGVGIMGWGSSLLMLKVPFSSEKSHELREKLMKFIASEVYIASIDLAEEKGMFPFCEPEKHAVGEFVQRLNLPPKQMERLRTIGIRNSSLLSIQPTGNTGILANVVSGGCEPAFMSEYIRTVIVNAMPDHIAEVTPKWYEGEWKETSMFKTTKEGDEEILRGVDPFGVVYKIDKNRGLTKEVLCQEYAVRHLKEKDQWDPKATWASTAMELTPDQHLEDLVGFAKYIDSAISKTINCPHNISFDNFKNVYLKAYQSGHSKGVTTYRAGTMTTVLAAKDEREADNSDEEIIKEDVKLPDSAPASMKTLKAEGKKWYVTVVYHEDNPDRPFALFVKTNARETNVVADEAVELLFKLARKKGIPKRHIDKVEEKLATDSNSSKVARLISFLLRHGVLIKNIVATLDKVQDAYVGTFVFQIKKFLSAYIKDGEKVEDEKCQECGSNNIVFSEGCKKCSNCGSSKCG